MELEEKVKKLEEEFQGLSKLLIKRTLCGDDVNEDLTEARQKLQKFTKSPFLSNPMAATGAKEFVGSRCCLRVDSLSKKINSWSEEGTQLTSKCCIPVRPSREVCSPRPMSSKNKIIFLGKHVPIPP